MEAPQRILLIQLRAIGDVLLTTPSVRAVKSRFPEAQIDFVTNPATAECLQGNPNLREVIVYPYSANDVIGALKFGYFLFRRKYDVAIDVLGTPGTAQMTFFSRARLRIGYDLRYRRYAYHQRIPPARDDIYNASAKMALLEPLGIASANPYPEVFIPEEVRRWAEDFFQSRDWENARVAAVAPAAKAQSRRWLPEYFASVADRLLELGYPVLMPWGPGERDYVERVAGMMKGVAVLSPKTTLMQLAALLQKCRLLVCNCGGTKHFAVAAGTPTLSVYGSSNPVAWTPPDDPRHVTLQADVDCLNCGLRECEPLDCMKKVTPDEVTAAIEQMGVL